MWKRLFRIPSCIPSFWGNEMPFTISKCWESSFHSNSHYKKLGFRLFILNPSSWEWSQLFPIPNLICAKAIPAHAWLELKYEQIILFSPSSPFLHLGQSPPPSVADCTSKPSKSTFLSFDGDFTRLSVLLPQQQVCKLGYFVVVFNVPYCQESVDSCESQAYNTAIMKEN